MEPKDYIASEIDRNKNSGDLFIAMIKKAFGENHYATIGHHIVFEADGDFHTENEIPAADTLMFDHEIMHAVFGHMAPTIMVDLALASVKTRDTILRWYFDKLGR